MLNTSIFQIDGVGAPPTVSGIVRVRSVWNTDTQLRLLTPPELRIRSNWSQTSKVNLVPDTLLSIESLYGWASTLPLQVSVPLQIISLIDTDNELALYIDTYTGAIGEWTWDSRLGWTFARTYVVMSADGLLDVESPSSEATIEQTSMATVHER